MDNVTQIVFKVPAGYMTDDNPRYRKATEAIVNTLMGNPPGSAIDQEIDLNLIGDNEQIAGVDGTSAAFTKDGDLHVRINLPEGISGGAREERLLAATMLEDALRESHGFFTRYNDGRPVSLHTPTSFGRIHHRRLDDGSWTASHYRDRIPTATRPIDKANLEDDIRKDMYTEFLEQGVIGFGVATKGELRNLEIEETRALNERLEAMGLPAENHEMLEPIDDADMLIAQRSMDNRLYKLLGLSEAEVRSVKSTVRGGARLSLDGVTPEQLRHALIELHPDFPEQFPETMARINELNQTAGIGLFDLNMIESEAILDAYQVALERSGGRSFRMEHPVFGLLECSENELSQIIDALAEEHPDSFPPERTQPIRAAMATGDSKAVYEALGSDGFMSVGRKGSELFTGNDPVMEATPARQPTAAPFGPGM